MKSPDKRSSVWRHWLSAVPLEEAYLAHEVHIHLAHCIRTVTKVRMELRAKASHAYGFHVAAAAANGDVQRGGGRAEARK